MESGMADFAGDLLKLQVKWLTVSGERGHVVGADSSPGSFPQCLLRYRIKLRAIMVDTTSFS